MSAPNQLSAHRNRIPNTIPHTREYQYGTVGGQQETSMRRIGKIGPEAHATGTWSSFPLGVCDFDL